MKKIIISIIILLLLILFGFFLIPTKAEFKDREGWLESVPTEVPWDKLDIAPMRDNKESLLWDDIIEFDDSVSGINHRLDVERVAGEWTIVWYGEQYKCLRGENKDQWVDILCP